MFRETALSGAVSRYIMKSEADMYTMSLEQARDYLVQYHMLDQRCHKSQAKQVFDRLRTIQYDPLKVVGRNAELVLKARINDFHPSDLNDWLYHRPIDNQAAFRYTFTDFD